MATVQPIKPWYNVERVSQPGSVILKQWNAERSAWRQAGLGHLSPRQRRDFAAGANTRLTSTWNSRNISANADIYRALDAVRARSRDLCNNNDYAKRFLAMVAANVVGGQGVVLQARVYDNPATPDTGANTAIENAWARWSRRGACDVTGRLSFRDIQRLVIMAVARDGEALVRVVQGGSAANPFGIALQILDADRIDTKLIRQAQSGVNEIKMGVEVDSFGRAVAYWLRPYHPSELFLVDSAVTGSHIRVPAAEIIHVFQADRPEQLRGMPWMHAAMTRLNNLGGYEEAAVIAARVGASKMGWFVQKDGTPSTATDGADGLDEEGVPFMEVEPGQFGKLPEGMEFQPFNPDYPHQMYGEFVKACLRGIASGLGVAYHALANDLEGVNYSSIRAGTLEERDQWMAVQQWFIDSFLEPVYAAWVRAALAFGQVTLQNGSPLSVAKLDKFSGHTWQPRRWPWVDPLKDMEAAVLAIKHGIKSPQSVAAEQGTDFEDVLVQIKAAQELAAQIGVTLGDPPPAPAEPAPQDPEQAEEQAKARAQLAGVADQLRELRHAVDLARAAAPQPIQVGSPVVNIQPPEVRNEIITPAPVVNVAPPNVAVEVAAPNVEIKAEAPVVNVAAPQVDVNVEAVMPDKMAMEITAMPTRETTSLIERDAAGDIKASKQTEKDV